MLTRNWSEKTLLRQLVVIKDDQSKLVASNQKNQNHKKATVQVSKLSLFFANKNTKKYMKELKLKIQSDFTKKYYISLQLLLMLTKI